MLRCQRNSKPDNKMKKNFSETIKVNRGVGDQRIRNMEANDLLLAKAIDELGQDIQDRDPIAFVTALPASPDPATLYFVCEDNSQGT